MLGFELKEISKTTETINPCKNNFVPVEKLFPHWKTAAVILKDFLQKIGGWSMVFDAHSLHIGLIFPFVLEELSGQMIPMVEMFPPEDKEKVKRICEETMQDYIPEEMPINKPWRGTETKHEILERIYYKEREIEGMGGRKIHAELAFRLGLQAFRFKNPDIFDLKFDYPQRMYIKK